MFNIYLETSGNNPLVFGGGSYDISASEDISGVHFVDGTRPGNTAVVDIAKSQVGNVNGQPYWSWYGFDSRVEWCACFVSWCYNQMGLTEPKFAGCTSGGMAPPPKDTILIGLSPILHRFFNPNSSIRNLG